MYYDYFECVVSASTSRFQRTFIRKLQENGVLQFFRTILVLKVEFQTKTWGHFQVLVSNLNRQVGLLRFETRYQSKDKKEQ